MRKLSVFMAAILVAMTLFAGCGNNNSEEPAATTAPASTTAPAKATTTPDTSANDTVAGDAAQDDAKLVREAIHGFMDAMYKQDFKKAEEFVKDYENVNQFIPSGDTDLDKTLTKVVYERLEYQINSVAVTGNKAVAKTVIKSPDLVDAYQKLGVTLALLGDTLKTQADAEGMSEAEYVTKVVMDAMADAEQLSMDVDVDMEKADGQWKIVVSDQLINAVTGNIKAGTAQ